MRDAEYGGDVATEILIIDDEAALREVVSFYLKRAGYVVHTAPDGDAGLETCRRVQPDIVLCDLRMPGMDGLEVLASLAAEFPEMPVILVSGMGGLADAIQALKLGAWDYVTKPIEDFAVLDHAIGKALERAGLRAENRAYREHLEKANAELERSLRRLREDETAGRNIQFRLLPEARAVFRDGKSDSAFECSHHLLTSAILSGDFVDYFDIDGERFGFYMADVSGHGVSSAFITVLLKSYMARYVQRNRQQGDPTILDPAAVLTGLNRDILFDGHGKFLTMFYGVLNPAQGRLEFANGGQFPFPILFDGQETRLLGGKSPPVGLFDDATYRTQTLDIPSAFSLTLFSDGILETLPQAGLADKQNALHCLARGDGHDAAAFARSLNLDDKTPPPDDISILNVRRLAA
nr:SpoIIE family protein phosphatase [Propionivibrio soli]